MNQYLNRIKINPIFLFIIAGICIGMLTPMICKADNETAIIKKIDPPRTSTYMEKDFKNIEEQMYYRIGFVDAVSNEAVVIGDIMYYFAPDVRINCPVGAHIGIKVNKKGQVIACEPVRRRQP